MFFPCRERFSAINTSRGIGRLIKFGFSMASTVLKDLFQKDLNANDQYSVSFYRDPILLGRDPMN